MSINSLQTRNLATSNATDWNGVGDTAHAVQFYEHEGTLAEQLAGYIGSALVTGNGALVIATRRRRHDVRDRLARRGFDLAVPQRQGRYVALDADETLAQCSGADGRLEPDLFRTVIGSATDKVRCAVGTPQPRLAAFGEMVALLCSANQFAQAIALEELWNELAAVQAFSLFCAYPMSLFKTDADAAARFMKICAQHSHVFSADRRNARSRAREL